MNSEVRVFLFVLWFISRSAYGAAVPGETYQGEFRTTFDLSSGLPDQDIRSIATDPQGNIVVGTAGGVARLAGDRFQRITQQNLPVSAVTCDDKHVWFASGRDIYRLSAGRETKVAHVGDANCIVHSLVAGDHQLWIATSHGLWSLEHDRLASIEYLKKPSINPASVRQVALARDGRVAIASANGLFLRNRRQVEVWQELFPTSGAQSWAPRDVRGVTFDDQDRLWMASPQGVASLGTDGMWTLFTGNEGLPYHDFTTVIATGDRIWFGTERGAICLEDGHWRYRMAPRWLPDDRVCGITAGTDGQVWFATPQGVGRIERRQTTLREKADHFERQIDQHHRRTPFGFVNEVSLARPGDLTTSIQHDSDNDGLWTAMYGAGECFAFAATQNPQARRRADAAYAALRFLSQVTQGGSPPALPGFPARSILPTSGHNPNEVHYTPENDRQTQRRDPLWKIVSPRWPTSQDGKWYWKCDTSSDELDGHYFFFAAYHDLVADDRQRLDVRDVVLAITDHLIDHQFELIDHDGLPTRWARFGPHVLNGGIMPDERGLNSLSMLSYLKVAEHMSGDPKYARVYQQLVKDHFYAINTLHPKFQNGPGTGNQSDDEMAFMGYYNLLKYETDASLRSVYIRSLSEYWTLERPECSPLFNFIFAVFDPARLAAAEPPAYLAEGVETLQRIPFDQVQWPYDYRHRLDLVHLPASAYRRESPGGHLRNGKVIPADERSFTHWNHDPWQIVRAGDGRTLGDGATFLLPYYLGLYHGFIK